MKQSRRGFTLIEMLVVATIGALLATMGLVSYATASRQARNARRQSDLEQVRAAMELYRTQNGTYPSGSLSSILSTLSNAGYVTNQAIADPQNVSPYVYSIDTASPFAHGCVASKSYELCARLEPSSSWYCVCNP